MKFETKHLLFIQQAYPCIPYAYARNSIQTAKKETHISSKPTF